MGRKAKGVIVDELRGRKRARWTRLGQRQTVYLGPADAPEVWHAALSRLHARLADDPHYLPTGTPSDYLVSELCRDFLASFDGNPRLKNQYRLTLRRLVAEHPDIAVSDFGPLAFADWMSAGLTRYKWGRAAVEKARRHILRTWQWGVGRERVQESLYRALQTVPLPKRARAAIIRHPAPEASIREALPFMSPPVAALVRVQLATGARPSEILRLRPMDLIKSGSYSTGGIEYPVFEGQWVTVIKVSKTGKPRVIHFGQAAIDAMRPLLQGRPDDRHIFRPRDVFRGSSEHYTPGGYARAVRRACKAAGIPPFTAYSLRHAAKHRIMTAFGSDHAKAMLGHSSPTMTARYAAGVLDSERAAEAARLPAAV